MAKRDAPYEVRYIEWTDAAGGSGWNDRGEMLERLRGGYSTAAVFTVGFVLYEDDESVTVVQSCEVTYDNVDAAITIPHFNINFQRRLL